MAPRQRFRQRARVTFTDAFSTRLVKRANEGVKEIMEKVFEESQQEVPYDTGRLQESGKLRDTGKSIIITYGNSEVNYAEVQHEDLSLNHPNGRKAKFIEDPLNRHKSDFIKNASKKIQEAIDEEKW